MYFLCKVKYIIFKEIIKELFIFKGKIYEFYRYKEDIKIGSRRIFFFILYYFE